MERLTAGTLESQRMLVPVVLDVSPAAFQTLVSRASELERLGYEIEPFGQTAVKVAALLVAEPEELLTRQRNCAPLSDEATDWIV